MISKQVKHKKSRRVSSPGWMHAKEFLLVFAVASLATVAVYTSRDDMTAFGLLSQPVYADFVPVDIAFHPEILLTQPFLELSLSDRGDNQEQVRAELLDPKTPPPVTDLSALNTRVGGEVLLTWSFPQSVNTVNIYRTQLSSESSEAATDVREEILVAEQVVTSLWIDDDVQNDVPYSYRVVTVTEVRGKTYESDPEIISVIPDDVIPPQAPTNVEVSLVQAKTDDGAATPALRVQWVVESSDEVAAVSIFRSEQFGSRGTLLTRIEDRSVSEYTDMTAPVNTPVYYTVVVYDAADNSSSDDFQMPVPGNESPFTPFDAAEDVTTPIQ